jgi:hypothetical protein
MMGTDMDGWVEYGVSGPSPQTTEWFPVISLSCLPSRDYDLFARLFGVRNRAGISPIAANRGIPPDVSFTVQKALRQIADAPYRDECYGYTWISWNKIVALHCAEGARDEEWKLLFEMMALLARNYGNEYVRMVVWFAG